MKYSLQISVTTSLDHPALHRPVMIETISDSFDKITDTEIDMVAEAFKKQVKDLIVFMAKG
jgi:hypothetical protein